MDKLTKKSLEKLPPYNLDAERAVLGAILLDNAAIHRALEIFDTDDFYRNSHQKIFNAMLDLLDRGDAVDLLVLRDELERRKDLEEIGGPAYLAALVDQVPTAANIEFHAKIVHEKAIARNLLNASIEIATRCYDDAEDVNDILEDAEQRIFSIAEGKIKQGFTPLEVIVKQGFEHIEELAERKSLITGVPTGFVDMDYMTSGLQPSDLIILAARPSMGKCIHKDSEIVLSDGSVKTIEEIVESRQGELFTLGSNLKLRTTSPECFVNDGVKPVFEVKTRLGRKIQTTLSHPFLTIYGWKPLQELRSGEKIAVPRKVEAFGKEELEKEKVKLLAYLIGDGNLTQNRCSFTNGNPVIQEDFCSAALSSFPNVCIRKIDSHGTRTPSFYFSTDSHLLAQRRKQFGLRLRAYLQGHSLTLRAVAHALNVSPSLVCLWCQGKTAPAQHMLSELCKLLHVSEKTLLPTGYASIRKSAPHAIRLWLEEVGLWGHSAHTKTVPDIVFQLSRTQLALFLNRLFATDGWASIQSDGAGQIGYSSVCEQLIRQIQHLLLRFGIISALKCKYVKYKEEKRRTWQLVITHQESLQIFINEIGILGKGDSLSHIQNALFSKRQQSNNDLIPVGIWDYIETIKRDESWQSLAKRAGIKGYTNIHVKKRAFSKKKLLLLASALQDQFLTHLAQSDIFWDEIVSIELKGKAQVYDLTIPETHNFVANDICVHNTALCLNMAQHVGVRAQVPTAIFSLEMSKEQLGIRLLCAESRLNSHNVRIGDLNDEDWERLAHASEVLAKAPIYIDDTPALGILEMRAKAKRLKMEKGLDLVIVDYLQLMQARARHENRQQEITEISRSLKALAKELNVPVVALSQLSRAVEQRTDKRPQLSDLRESGAIEQDADVVMFIYRPEVYGFEGTEGLAEIIIGKQRNGPVGSVQLAFIKEYTRFENLETHQQVGASMPLGEIQPLDENPF